MFISKTTVVLIFAINKNGSALSTTRLKKINKRNKRKMTLLITWLTWLFIDKNAHPIMTSTQETLVPLTNLCTKQMMI